MNYFDTLVWLQTRNYDKHDNFNFPIPSFLFCSSNRLSVPPYDVYISHLIRYAHICSHYTNISLIRVCFLHKTKPCTNRVVRKTEVKSTPHEFYWHHCELVDRNDASMSQITSDMCSLSYNFRFKSINL